MNWKEEFIKLLEAGTFKTNSEIDDYADEHNLPVADVWQCFAEYRDVGQTYGIDRQLNELTLEDIMENIKSIYKEVYKK